MNIIQIYRELLIVWNGWTARYYAIAEEGRVVAQDTSYGELLRLVDVARAQEAA